MQLCLHAKIIIKKKKIKIYPIGYRVAPMVEGLNWVVSEDLKR